LLNCLNPRRFLADIARPTHRDRPILADAKAQTLSVMQIGQLEVLQRLEIG